MSERVCPHCGAPLEGVSIYDDTICEYCGSEVKVEKRPTPPSNSGNRQQRGSGRTYKITWIDTYLTNSDYKNRSRCVAVQTGEKRKLNIVIFYDEIPETVTEEVKIDFYSYTEQKIVSRDSVKSTFKKGEQSHIYMKPVDHFKTGEYLCRIAIGDSEVSSARLIIGNAPIIKESFNEAINREICKQAAKNMCERRKLVKPWMIKVPSNVMALEHGIKYKKGLGIPEGVETYMIIEMSIRRGKRGIAICDNGLYISSDYGKVYMSWLELLLSSISAENGLLRLGKHKFSIWSEEMSVMADLLADIQRLIINGIKV